MYRGMIEKVPRNGARQPRVIMKFLSLSLSGIYGKNKLYIPSL